MAETGTGDLGQKTGSRITSSVVFHSSLLSKWSGEFPPLSGLLGTLLKDGSMLLVGLDGAGAGLGPSCFDLFALPLGTEQMLSHGTADVVLEACTDFWDGADIYPLSGSDRWVRSFASLSAHLIDMGHLRTTHLTSTLLPWQKESAGFLPASLPVWLLLCLRLQAHELCPILSAQWQVH